MICNCVCHTSSPLSKLKDAAAKSLEDFRENEKSRIPPSPQEGWREQFAEEFGNEIGPIELVKIDAFIYSLIEKVRQEEHQSVNQIYKTREEVFQEGIKMERERILAALPTPTNGLEINYRKKIERAIYQPSE
jgi:hypothetical protein